MPLISIGTSLESDWNLIGTSLKDQRHNTKGCIRDIWDANCPKTSTGSVLGATRRENQNNKPTQQQSQRRSATTTISDVYTVKIGAFKEDMQKGGVRNDVRNVPLKANIELTDRQTVILSVLRDNVSLDVPLNTTILSQKLKVARKTMQRELGELQKLGAVSRLGGRKFGYWIVNEDWK